MENDIYKTPESNLVDDGVSSEGLVLASRFSRFAAAFIDGIIMMSVTLPLMYFTGGFVSMTSGVQPSLQYTLAIGAVGLLVFVLINGSFLIRYGQTVGKKLLRIKIVDLEGRLPSVKSHLLPRYAVYMLLGYIPVAGSLLSLINILFIFGSERRCIHDRVASTRVVDC
ncbi:MAG: RDD family protein [Chromatiales bacterium]|nr:RDD family protein [Chromatiales bacterium]